MTWAPLLKVRDRVYPRPDLATPDQAVLSGACPQGHPVVHAREVMDAPDADRAAFVERLRSLRSAEAGRARCIRCGKPPAPEGLTLLYASFLPVARVDLLARVEPAGAFALALRPLGGEARAIAGDEPELQELLPAQRVRIGRLVLRGLLEGFDAETLFAEAIEIAHDYPAALTERRATLGRSGEKTAALQSVLAAVKRAPTWPHAWFALGDELESVKNWAEALAAHQQAVRLDPTFADAHLQLGSVQREVGRLHETLRSYQTALAIAPRDPFALLNLAIVFASAGQVDEALDAVARIRPSSTRAYPHLKKTLDAVLERFLKAATTAGRWWEAERAATLRVLHTSTRGPWCDRAVALCHLGAIPDARMKALRSVALGLDEDVAQELLLMVAGRDPGEERVLARDASRPFRWADTMGRDCLALDHPVDVETTHRFEWRPQHVPTLASDADLYRLLVAKGHNAYFAEEASASDEGFGIRSSFDLGEPQGGEGARERAPKDEGRRFVIVVQDEPAPDFLRFAAATQWRTLDGRTVVSGPVQVILEREGWEPWALSAPYSFVTPDVPRILATDEDAVHMDRFPEETPLGPRAT